MTRTLALAFSLAASLSPAPVAAQAVGLTAFSGPRNRQARAIVRAALEERFAEVVDIDTSRDLERVDLVVTGQLQGLRARPRMTLVLTDPAGNERARRRFRLNPRRRALAAEIRFVIRRMLAEIDELPPANSRAEAPEPSSSPPRAGPEGPSPAAVDDEDRDASATSSARRSSASSRRPYVHLLVTAGPRNRDIAVSLTASQIEHQVPLYPELGAELRVRPFSGAGSAAAGFRMRGRFAFGLLFDAVAASGSRLEGWAWVLGGDLAYLAPLDSDGWVELGPLVGGGYSRYRVEDNGFVNSVDYGFLDARLSARVRLIGEQFVIRAEGGYRFSGGLGTLAREWGAITGHGAVVEGGIEGAVPIDDNGGVSWLLAVEWQQSWLSFDDSGIMGQALDGTEGFVRGRLALGLALR